MIDLFDQLNPKQREAVEATHGPVLVIAGAGSGKTKALTHRIAHMILGKNISPWNILAVTFTNKAAGEMKQRIVKLLDKHEDDADIPTIGTFHAVCVRILRKHIHEMGYENSFVIYDTADQQILVKRILNELQVDDKQMKPRAILNYISGAKNELIGPDQYSQFAHNFFTKKVAEVYVKYQKDLRKNNALDFDDIIMLTVNLFKQHPEILDKFQEKFKFISVDEYQDTNHAQYILTNLLAQKYRNLCVIGDSDQSIYSFRGANISNILNFEKDYVDAKMIMLEQNYRSTQHILDAAHQIIVKNIKRKDKKLWTERDGGEKLTLVETENERAEGEFIAREIINRIKLHEKPDYRDFVVLYRTNAQSRVMEEVFLRYGLPYKIVGGIKFYERKEIKDLVAYLRLIQNPNDSVSLLRVINTPARKIGAKTLEIMQRFSIEHNLSMFETMEKLGDLGDIRDATLASLKNFVALIRDLQAINKQFAASGLIKHVIEHTGYKAMIDDNTAEGEARIENMRELVTVASKYDQLEPVVSLSIFLEEIALIADIDTLKHDDNSVTFMTIHSSKGLEFPVVFLAGLEEGIFPHSRSLLERDELEEERRLMYVAITRARNKIFMLHAKNRTLYGETHSSTPSQFLMDIPEEITESQGGRIARSIRSNEFGATPLPNEMEPTQNEIASEAAINEFSDGDKVFHQTFGDGVVVSVMGGVATVCFKDIRYGIKKLALSIAPLKKIS